MILAARVDGEAFEFVDPPSTALRPGDALGLERETVAEEALDADRLAAEIGGYGNTSSDEERERRRKKRAKGRRPPPKRPAPGPEVLVDLTKMMASLSTFLPGHASPKAPQVICLEESRAVKMRLRGLFAERE